MCCDQIVCIENVVDIQATYSILNLSLSRLIADIIKGNKQGFINVCTNSLIYYVTEDLNDPTNGWEDFDTLIMRMGFLNPDVLKFLNVSFYYGEDEYIGSSKVTLDMFEDDSGTLYIPLPSSTNWHLFTIENNARIVFAPTFNTHEDFLGDFFGQGLPTTQTIEWDNSYVEDGYLNVDLIRRIFSDTQSVVILNELFEPVYKISEIDNHTETFEIYDNRRHYEVEYNNLSLPQIFTDPNGNTIVMRNGDLLYLKYNATLEASIGLTVDEMILQRAPDITNYLTEYDDVPIAEISLLGINTDGNTYTLDDIYGDRDKLVAWETALDLTPFESEFYNTYQQRVFNISFEDIYSGFKISDPNNVEHCYITDVLITSNDPRYQIVVDSFFIFEFDYNATLYDSEIVDIYPNNHIKTFYFGDYGDIYSEVRELDASEFLPLYGDNHYINETWYFDAFDDNGNYYYFDSHLFAINTSSGIYDIIWNPMYSGEYYDAYTEDKEDLREQYQYYQPHIANFSYLYISWADANAWKEWHTIEAPNVNISTLEVMFEWYDDIAEEYESIYYNQTLNEFEARNIAVEVVYPYNYTSDTGTFLLSQDYSNAQNLDILKIVGYFFNESKLDFDPIDAIILTNKKSMNITAPTSFKLNSFEKIIVYLNFSEGAYSDYTQFRLLQNATDNHPTVPTWTKNDSLYVDFEYEDIDYFLLMEEYAVGSDDSMFEYFAYTRNYQYVDYDEATPYSILQGVQYRDFENFTKAEIPSTMLEFLDFDEDGTHEVVIQKDDITRDGLYDSFKYGYINPAGEIAFYTLVQSVVATEVHSEKNNEVRYTEEFKIPLDIKEGALLAYAQRTIITNNTITNKIYRMTTLIQKDEDHDGYVDREVSFEEMFYTTEIVTYSTEITHLRMQVEGEFHEGYLTEYRNSTYVHFDSSMSYCFRDFEYNEVVSTRYYDDVFPNELSEMYNMDNNLMTATNDYGDDDSSNDITTQIPEIDRLLSLSHDTDNVPAFFDRRIIVDDPLVIDNILATEKQITIPGQYDVRSGIADYMEEQEIVADVIEVIPEQGVYYDNVRGFDPENLPGYSYLYYDENGDGAYNTIFIADEDGNVVGVGFDYDGNSIFEPHKLQVVEKHIMYSEPSGWQSLDELGGRLDYQALKFAGHDFINYQDEDSYDGLFLESTFRDSLFDVWKTQFTGYSSKLMSLAKSITANQFIQSLTPLKIAEDLLFQVGAQVAAFIGGNLLGIGTGMLTAFIAGKLGAEVGSTIAPGIGTLIGFIIGFFITYLFLNVIRSYQKQQEMNNYLAAHVTKNEDYEGTETLSDKWWSDRYFGDTMPNTLFGSASGVYTTVRGETDKHIFEGTVMLAKPGIEKTTWFGTRFVNIALDYSSQTRSYIQYSDFGDPLFMEFLNSREFYTHQTVQVGLNTIEYVIPSNAIFRDKTIMYLENQIYNRTKDESQSFDSIIPYMMSVVPTLRFADSETTLVPEFYMEYPIYVDHTEYEYLKDEFYHIYKIYDGTEDTFQLIPEDFVENHVLMSDIISIIPIYIDSMGNEEILDEETDVFKFNSITGELKINDTNYLQILDNYIACYKESYKDVDGYEGYFVLKVNIEKYRDITVERSDITSEEAYRIATMQSAHASILEYLYQFTLAQETQERLNEIAYTIFVTITSTIMSIAITGGLGKLFDNMWHKLLLCAKAGSTLEMAAASVVQRMGMVAGGTTLNTFKVICSAFAETGEELGVDPWIEAWVSNAVKDLGHSELDQIFWSCFAESGRETFISGPVSIMREGLYSHRQVQIQENLQAIQQDQLVQNTQEIKQGLSETTKEVLQTSLSTIVMFAGVLTGGFLGSLGTAIGTGFIVMGGMVDNIADVKEVFRAIIESRRQKIQSISPEARVNLAEAIERTKLEDPQKASQQKIIPSLIEEHWSRQVTHLGVFPSGLTVHFQERNPDNYRETIIMDGMVKSEFDLLGNLVKKDEIDFTSEVVEKVYEFLPSEQKYIIDEAGNVLELDPIGVVRTALEIMDYQLDPAWYAWGTKAPVKLTNYNNEFQQFLEQVADVLHITKTKLVSKTIDNTYDLYQKIRNDERLSSNDLQDLVLEIAKNIYDSSEANGDKQVIFALCDKFLKDTGNPLGSLGIYFNDLQYYQYFKRAQEVVEVFSKGFEPQSLSNKEARLWYMKQETKIKDLLDSRLPLKLQAVQAFYLRNCLRIKARDLMKDRHRADALMKTERNYRWDEIVLKYKALKYKGNALWEIIIESSMKSRPTVNKILRISEWMVYPGQNWQEYF